MFKMSEQIDQIATALVKAQSEFKELQKSKVNPFYNSKYADMNDIGKAITNLREAIDILKGTGDKISLFEAEETLKGVKKLLN